MLFRSISVKGLRRKGMLALITSPLQLGWALLQSLAVIIRRRPAAVLGMGGFVSGPGGVAAWLTRRPLIIHEQNAAAGMTNRLLARLARVVLQAFPGSFNSAVVVETVGNPVREDIAAVAAPTSRYGDRRGPLRFLCWRSMCVPRFAINAETVRWMRRKTPTQKTKSMLS